MIESYSPNTIVNVRPDIENENMVSSRQVPSGDPSLVDNNDCIPRHRQAANLCVRVNDQPSVLSFCEQPLRHRLGDRALSCSSQPIEPVNERLAEVPGPELDLG